MPVADPQRRLSLIADIGGTHARFALASEGRVREGSIRDMATADYGSLEAAARNYLNLSRDAGGAAVVSACFALAGPVRAGRAALTNGDWSSTESELARNLNLEQVRLVNDFEALAYALPGLLNEQLQVIGPSLAPISGCKTVIGPGTGFGCANAIPCGDAWQVIATEGGHASLAPSDDLELAIFAWLLQHGRQATREQLLCGSGIETLYQALCDIFGLAPTVVKVDEIVREAKRGQEDCVRCLAHFCALLGTAARDQALSTGARGGVYIAGGVVRHFTEFLLDSMFRQRFENSDKMAAYLQDIPTYVITEANPGLIGAARCAIRDRY